MLVCLLTVWIIRQKPVKGGKVGERKTGLQFYSFPITEKHWEKDAYCGDVTLYKLELWGFWSHQCRGYSTAKMVWFKCKSNHKCLVPLKKSSFPARKWAQIQGRVDRSLQNMDEMTTLSLSCNKLLLCSGTNHTGRCTWQSCRILLWIHQTHPPPDSPASHGLIRHLRCCRGQEARRQSPKTVNRRPAEVPLSC